MKDMGIWLYFCLLERTVMHTIAKEVGKHDAHVRYAGMDAGMQWSVW